MPSFRCEEPKLWCQIAWVRFLFLSINWPSVNGKFSFYFPKQKHRLPEFRSTKHLTNNVNATPSKNPTNSGTRRNKNEGAKVNHMAKRFEKSTTNVTIRTDAISYGFFVCLTHAKDVKLNNPLSTRRTHSQRMKESR